MADTVVEVIVSGLCGNVEVVETDTTQHNSLFGLQGGSGSEYYHLSSGLYSYVTGLSGNSSVGGSFSGNIHFADYIDFHQNPTGLDAAGRLVWDPIMGTVSLGFLGGNATSHLGEDLSTYVRNVDTRTILKGEAVYLYGAQGDKPTIKLASNLADVTSSKTLGLAAEDISVNQLGFVKSVGMIDGLNLGAYTPGDVLWLGTGYGSITTTKAVAPQHLVFIGVVSRANNGNGQVYVKVQNGYELDEIHDVLISGSKLPGQTILYDSSIGVWRNANLSGTANQITVTNSNGAVTFSLATGISGINSLTAQSGNNLILNGGGGGASIALGQGINGGVTFSPAGTGGISSISQSLTGSSATSLLDLSTTWNTTGNPTAIKLNVTNTASGSSSKPLDIQVSGTSKLTMLANGYVGINKSAPDSLLHVLGSSAEFRIGYNGGNANYIDGATTYFRSVGGGTSGIVAIQGTTASTSTSTGALTVAGGLGVAGTLTANTIASDSGTGMALNIGGGNAGFTLTASGGGGFDFVVANATNPVASVVNRFKLSFGGNSLFVGANSSNAWLDTGVSNRPILVNGSLGNSGGAVIGGSTPLVNGASFGYGGLTVYGLGAFSPANYSASSWTTTGALMQYGAATVTNSSTLASGTAASAVFHSWAQPTLAATNASVTTTDAATLYVAGGPAAGTNQTLTNSWGLWNVGKTRLDGAVTIGGATTISGSLTVNSGDIIIGSGQTYKSATGWDFYLDCAAGRTLYARVGGSTALTINSALQVQANATTASTSTTTGALVVSGGAGIAGAVYAGADSYFNGVRVGLGASAVSTNTAVGSDSTSSITTGNNNVAIGYQTLRLATSGSSNTAIGARSLSQITTGGNNVSIGKDSQLGTSTGTNNVSVGNTSMQNNSTGTENVAIGTGAIITIFSGTQNVAVGNGALAYTSTGSYNTAIGESSIYFATTSVATLGAITPGSGYTDGTYSNVLLTYVSGAGASTMPRADITVSGGAVTACTLTVAADGSFGGAGFRDTTTVMSCASIGSGTGFAVSPATLSSGQYNAAVGRRSQYKVTTGYSNSSIGTGSLYSTTTGSSNIAIGANTAFSNTTGYDNTIIGTSAGYYNVTGYKNIAIGAYAGRYETGNNTFYVDSIDRGNTANEKARALLYGTFNSTAANQTLTINAATTVSNTTASTSTTTGALTVAGGLGVAGATYVGGGINSTQDTLSLTLGTSSDVSTRGEMLRLNIGSSGGATGYLSFKRVGGGGRSINFGINNYAPFSLWIDGASGPSISLTTSSNGSFTHQNQTWSFGSGNGVVDFFGYFNAGSAGGEAIPVALYNNQTSANSTTGVSFGSVESTGNICVLSKITSWKPLASGAMVGAYRGGLRFFTTNDETTPVARFNLAYAGNVINSPSNYSQSAWTTTGALTTYGGATITDSSTAGSGTAASAVFHSWAVPTLAATNASVTTTDAATLYVAGGPAAGTNQTLTNSWGLWNVGKTRLDDDVYLLKSSGSNTLTLGSNTAGLGSKVVISTTGNQSSSVRLEAQSVSGNIRVSVSDNTCHVGGTFITELGFDGTTGGGGTYINFGTNGSYTGLHVTHNRGSDLMTMLSSGATTFVGTITTTNTTASTSTGTGSIVTSGGAGIAGAVYAGADSYFNGVRFGLGASAVSTNIAIGASALNSNTTGNQNVGIGRVALTSNTTGYGNIAIGQGGNGVLRNNTTGYLNVAIGSDALRNNKTGSEMVAVGSGALSKNTLNWGGTGIGYNALGTQTTGILALGSFTGGSGYTDGTYTGVALTYVSGSGWDNTPTANITVSGGAVTACTIAYGGSAFIDTTTVMSCASIGPGTGFTVTISSLQTGGSNTAVGHYAGYLNPYGTNNVAIGENSQYGQNSTTNASYNTSVGATSLQNATTGSQNLALGYSTLNQLSTGNYNVAVGNYSLYANSTGSGNVAIGYYAGRYATGSNELYIDNQNRTNTAGDKAGALLYGTFNATPSSQTLTINAATTVSNTTASASTSTGSLVVSGGIGVGGRGWFGDEIISSGSNAGLWFYSRGGLNSNFLWYSQNGTKASLYESAGGNNILEVSTGGTLSILGTTDSSSTTTGSLLVSGGVGIIKNLYVGGAITTATSSTSFAPLNIPQGSAPTTPANGDLWMTSAGVYYRANGTTVGPLTSGATLADPSATIGLTAVNGTATSAMRSDAAPALSQAIVPTWTGLHTYSPTIAANTSGNGIVISNTGTASNGNQFYSPRIKLIGQGWNGSASQAANIIFETQPIQNSGTINMALIAKYSAAAGTEYPLMTIGGDGSIAAPEWLSVGIGANHSSNGTSNGNVVVGGGSRAGQRCVSIGGAATTNGQQDSVAIGWGASTSAAGNYSIALGSGTTINGYNIFAAGSSSGPINSVFFGKGQSNSSATAYTIYGTGGTGTNNVGGAINICGGLSTGNSAPASVVIQAGAVGSSGTTAQTATNVASFNTTGITLSYITTASNTTDATSSTTGSLITSGGLGVAKSIFGAGKLSLTPTAFSQASWTTTGALTRHDGIGVTNNSTAANNTAASAVFHSWGTPTLLATNTGVTTTDAATCYIAGAPTASTNQTITNAWSLWAVGNVRVDGSVSDSAGNLRSLPQNAQTASYTLVAGDNGKHISITTGGVTVPSGIFTAGQTIVIFNNSSSAQTITQGGSVTMYLAGTTTTGNRTLASYGLATIICVASNTFAIMGAGLT